MEKVVKINSTEINPELSNEKPYKGMAVVPSTLMRTPSSNFAKAFEFLVSEGIYQIDLQIKDDTKLDFKKLEGFFKSDVGIHFVNLINDVEYIVDLANENNGDYDVYLTIKFNENDSENANYVLDDFIFDLVSSGDPKPYDNSQKIATLTLTNGNISNLEIVCNFVDKPNYNEHTQTVYFIKQSVIAGEDLSKLDIVRVIGSENGLPKVAKITALTQAPFGICLDDVPNGNQFELLIQGAIENIDTSDYEVGKIFSDGTGGFQNDGISTQVGEIYVVDNANGKLYFKIQDNSRIYESGKVKKDTEIETGKILLTSDVEVEDGIDLTINGKLIDLNSLT